MKSPTTSEEARPPVVGVLGGICSGKTTVARMLADRGFELINADRIGHDVLGRPDVKSRLRAGFGPGIFDDEGQVDRCALAQRVFGNSARTEKLNSIVHPPILEEIARRIRRCQRPVVLDAALLMEKGLHEKWCDFLVFVHTPRQQRIRRARQRRNWDERELRRREAAQLAPECKRAHADYLIDNTGSFHQLQREVSALHNHIRTVLSHRFEAADRDR